MSNINTYTNQYSGYTNRLETTNTPDPSYMVSGSQNAIVDWMNTISSRQGYELYGAAGSTGGVKGRFKWRTNRGQFYNFRKVGQEFQVSRIVDGTPEWNTLEFKDGTSYLPVDGQVATFASIFNDTRKIDEVLIAGGNARFFSWSGAAGTVASSTATTITLAEDAGAQGFAASGTVYIEGDAYAYTGISGNDFTGVTPDASGITAGAFAHEGVASNAISSIPANFTADYIGVFRNQAYISSATSRIHLVSNAVDYTNFTTSTAVGGARLLTLDDNGAGFEASKESMIIFGQNDSVFRIKYTVSADQTKEYFEVERMATAPNQGLISPLAKVRVKNAIVYITQEKTLDVLEFVENISDLQTVPISDIIKNDFDALDFTGASIDYWQRNLMVALPASNRCYMYDLERKLWQAPIVWNGATVGMFDVDEDNNLIGHDANSDQSYKMFTGDSDNGLPIESNVTFAYNNFGDRFSKKRFTTYVQDGYISGNGVLTRTLDYDYKGRRSSVSIDFAGSEEDYVYIIDQFGGLGKARLGEMTLGGSSLLPVENLRRFRYADAVVPFDFYELRVSYAMTTLNGAWRLVAHGSDTIETLTTISDITRVR